MSIQKAPPIWTTGWTDVLTTGTWRAAVPSHRQRPAPCHHACPVGGEIPVWIQHAREQRYHEAWLQLVVKNPFPSMTGRICHHPCEGECNRSQYDGAVTINALEQFVGDLALQEQWELPKPSVNRQQRVAVVGGGPAGLSCAYQLRLRGYRVTLFDDHCELGGVLRYGIPQYRLPREVVDGEIRRLLALNIDVRLNKRVRADELEGLEREYDAVFLAFGAQRTRTLPQFPVGDPRVLDGLRFLTVVNQGEAAGLGKQVVVIGGGSVAMDVARTARRLGSQVKVLALESRESLPAQADEVKEAREEGIVIIGGAMVQTTAADREGIELGCVKVTLDPSAPIGVLKPAVLPGTEFRLKADSVILAVGQTTDLTGWEAQLAVDNSLVVVRKDLATSRRGVFAGGDAAGMERYVSVAIGQGKRAASAIAVHIGAEFREYSGGQPEDPVSFEEINTFYFPFVSRESKVTRAAEERIEDFGEVKVSFSVNQVQEQAGRCFSCGNCIQCDNCFYFCPDMAIIKDPALAEHYRVLDQYCKGCGCCVEECPRGAVVLKEETR